MNSVTKPRPLAPDLDRVRVALIKTALAPMAVVENRRGVAGVVIGESLAALRAVLGEQYARVQWAEASAVGDALLAYTQGAAIDWSAVPLDWAPLTDFRTRVTQACQAVGYGQTSTYAALATEVGQPRAVRAVGRVMATNPWPIIVPCHRILRTDGSLGGYSAPTGIALKERLLALEIKQAATAQAARPQQASFRWDDGD